MQEAGNTIGNIPIKWYDKYDHIGYDLNGEKIMRPKSLDAIDKYIHTHDKNERYSLSIFLLLLSSWTIYDEKEGKEIRLTPRQIAIIKNIQNHQAALPGYNDEPEYIPYASGEVEPMPLVDPNPVKSTFIPAVWERRKVAKILKRMREGRYKLCIGALIGSMGRGVQRDQAVLRHVGRRGRSAAKRPAQSGCSETPSSG